MWLNSAISHWYLCQNSMDVCSNKYHLDTSVTAVCCFERVVYFLIVCMDRGSCLSWNLNFIKQICWGLQLNGGMYHMNKTYKGNVSHICFLIGRVDVKIM